MSYGLFTAKNLFWGETIKRTKFELKIFLRGPLNKNLASDFPHLPVTYLALVARHKDYVLTQTWLTEYTIIPSFVLISQYEWDDYSCFRSYFTCFRVENCVGITHAFSLEFDGEKNNNTKLLCALRTLLFYTLQQRECEWEFQCGMCFQTWLLRPRRWMRNQTQT